jgi:hypothetical protein
MFWFVFFLILFGFGLIGGTLNLLSDLLRGLTNGFRDFKLGDHIFWIAILAIIIYFVV